MSERLMPFNQLARSRCLQPAGMQTSDAHCVTTGILRVPRRALQTYKLGDLNHISCYLNEGRFGPNL